MILYRKNRVKISLILVTQLIAICFSGCKVQYSFSGASIAPELKTVSIQYFPNRAPLGPGDISQRLFNTLREKIESQTSLVVVNGIGDVNFEGEINGYDTKPRTITADERAEQNRLTISIRVKYTNNADSELDFDKTFSRFVDYSSSQNIDEETENEVIVQLVQDMFNEAFVNW